MSVIGGIGVFNPPRNDPPPPDPGPGDPGGGTGGSPPPAEEGGASGTGTGGAGSGGTGGSGTSTGGSAGQTGGTGSGTSGPDAPGAAGPASPPANRAFIIEGVISKSQRLDLAFARVLDATLARRYAEAARLEVISDGLLDRLRAQGGVEGEFARDVAALRAKEERDTRPERTDRAA